MPDMWRYHPGRERPVRPQAPGSAASRPGRSSRWPRSPAHAVGHRAGGDRPAQGREQATSRHQRGASSPEGSGIRPRTVHSRCLYSGGCYKTSIRSGLYGRFYVRQRFQNLACRGCCRCGRWLACGWSPWKQGLRAHRGPVGHDPPPRAPTACRKPWQCARVGWP
jgi:hypothetical protein